MRLSALAIAALLAAPPGVHGQESEPSHGDPEEVKVYAMAVAALVGPPDAAAPFYIAARVHIERGRLLSSTAPEAVSHELAEAGYSVEMAELAENGLWQVPRGELFLMLRRIEWWPGRKIARLSIDVGSGARDLKEVAFKFRREKGQGWVLIEKGPAESEG